MSGLNDEGTVVVVAEVVGTVNDDAAGFCTASGE